MLMPMRALMRTVLAIPRRRGDFLIADSCNSSLSSDYLTPVHLRSLAGHPCAGQLGHRTRRAGEGQACWPGPCCLPAGPAEAPGQPSPVLVALPVTVTLWLEGPAPYPCAACPPAWGAAASWR